MPRRTNLFQETVAAIHRHLAGQAAVEESAMLVQRTTGEPREVDVVLRTTVAGHEVIVSVEARASGRKADLTWVESMLGKHADLPTSKLVLVSEAGFTRSAKRQAQAKGAATVAPEGLTGDDAGRQIVERLSRFPREMTAGVTRLEIFVRGPGCAVGSCGVPKETVLHSPDGQPVARLGDMVVAAMAREENFQYTTLRDSSLMPTQFKTTITVSRETEGGAWPLPGGLSAPVLCVSAFVEDRSTGHRLDRARSRELLELDRVELDLGGLAEDVQMAPRKLRGIAYASTEALLYGEKASIFVTATEDGRARMDIRVREGTFIVTIDEKDSRG